MWKATLILIAHLPIMKGESLFNCRCWQETFISIRSFSHASNLRSRKTTLFAPCSIDSTHRIPHCHIYERVWTFGQSTLSAGREECAPPTCIIYAHSSYKK